MTTPAEDLAPLLEAVLPGVNVYPSLTNQVKPPAVVLVPDYLWLEPGPALGMTTEQWLAVAVVPAGDPRSGTAELHRIVLEVVDVLPDGWSLRDVGRPLVDESTGLPMLAAG